jgi:hypothetical protein
VCPLVRRPFAAGLALALFGASASARAEPRTHDGFYFEAALGLGFATVSGPAGQSSHGVAALPSLLAGGTPLRGLVLGGGLIGAVGFAPSGALVAGAPSDPASPRDPSLSLAIVGPFVDYFPDPRGGFHLQALGGYAELAARQSDDALAANPAGVGFALGVGQELWIGEQWSAGLLGRFAFALPRYHGISYPTYAPGLLLSFTCH